MTGCLYISPPVDPAHPEHGCIPVLIADTLITWRGVPAETEVTPTTVTSDNARQLSSVTLGRKVHIVGNAAVALAGDGDCIKECVESLRWKLDKWTETGRPMREFGDHVNKYAFMKNGAPVLRVEAIGVYAFPAPSTELNSMVRGPHFTLQNLGLCGSIGSGGEDLEILAREFDRYMKPEHEPHNRIRNFVAAINGTQLAKELGGNKGKSWGGYIEYTYLEHATKTWHRGPRALDFFYLCRRISETHATVALIPRIVAYDPGVDAARILVAAREAGDKYVFNEFQLAKEPLPGSDWDFWSNWRHQSFTVTFIVEDSASGVAQVALPCRLADVDKAFFEIKSGAGTEIKMGLEPDYLHHLAEQACAHRGWKYTPLAPEHLEVLSAPRPPF